MADNQPALRRKSLFREAAVEHMESTWSGRVLLMRPLSFTLYTTGAVALLAILIGFVSWASYTKRELAVGFVRPVHRDIIIAENELGALLQRMADYRPHTPIFRMKAEEL